MSVATCEKMWEGRTGSRQNTETKYQQTYRIIMTAESDTAATIFAAGVLPAIGAAFPGDSSAYCVDVSLQGGADGLVWVATASYTNKVEQQSLNDDPLARVFRPRWSFENTSRLSDRDYEGTAYASTAGEYFDPPMEIPEIVPVVRFIRNEATFDPNLTLAYANKVNSRVWFGGEEKQVLCSAIFPSPQEENGLQYEQVTYEFKFCCNHLEDPDGDPVYWDLLVVNRGMWELVGGKRRLIKDDTKQFVSKPVNLNADGTKMDDDETDPHVLRFVRYGSIDFHALGLL